MRSRGPHDAEAAGPLSLRGGRHSRRPPSLRGPDALWSIPPGGLETLEGLKEGDEAAGAVIEQLVDSCLGLVCWLGRTPEGAVVTVVTLEPGASQPIRARFLAKAAEVAERTAGHDVEGLGHIVAVDPLECAYAVDAAPVGTMADLPSLDWDAHRASAFIRALCGAVSWLHDMGLVHGCLRPENVLVDGKLRPLVINVQAVDVAGACRADRGVSAAVSRYAAPEVRGGAAPDERADVYSLGQMAHFLLLGKEPALCHEPLPMLLDLSHLPPALVRIIRRCTVADRALRYPNVVALVLDLDRWTEDHDVGLAHPAVKETFVPKGAAAAPSAPVARPTDAMDSAAKGPGAAPARATVTTAGRAARSRGGNPAELERDRAVERAAGPSPAATATHSDAALGPPMRRAALQPGRRRRWLLAGALGLLLATLGACFVLGASGLWAHAATLAAALLGAAALPDVAPSPVKIRLLAALVLGAAVLLVRPADWVSRPRSAAQGLLADRVEERVAAFRTLRAAGEQRFASMSFAKAQLGGQDFRALVLDSSSFVEADCTGCDFAGASLLNVDFTGANLSAARLPDANGTQLVGLDRATCDQATLLPAGWRCQDGRPSTAP